MKKLLILTLLSIIMTSCNMGKDVPVFSGRLTGALSGTLFTSDEGLDVNIKSAPEGFPESSERIMISGSYYRRKSGGFDADVKDFIEPLCKDAISRALSGGKDFGSDAANIERGWISGGYANLYVQVIFREGSETKHLLNLVYEDTLEEPADTLRFTLHHDAFGEALALDDEGKPQEGCIAGIAAASFNILKFMPESVDEIPVKITGSWYRNDGNGNLTLETYPSSRTGILRRH